MHLLLKRLDFSHALEIDQFDIEKQCGVGRDALIGLRSIAQSRRNAELVAAAPLHHLQGFSEPGNQPLDRKGRARV